MKDFHSQFQFVGDKVFQIAVKKERLVDKASTTHEKTGKRKDILQY